MRLIIITLTERMWSFSPSSSFGNCTTNFGSPAPSFGYLFDLIAKMALHIHIHGIVFDLLIDEARLHR